MINNFNGLLRKSAKVLLVIGVAGGAAVVVDSVTGRADQGRAKATFRASAT